MVSTGETTYKYMASLISWLPMKAYPNSLPSMDFDIYL